MPLAFQSTTHGTVAFGFFNIDTDLLLLENRFFFATGFTRLVGEMCAATADRYEAGLEAWTIDRREDVGDLMGAIRGTGHAGFIGGVYRRFPFPAAPEDFRQKPEGERNRPEIAALIDRWARREAIAVVADLRAGEVDIGGVGFTLAGFGELVRYVERGGWPRWRDDTPPACVREMMRAVNAGGSWILAWTRPIGSAGPSRPSTR